MAISSWRLLATVVVIMPGCLGGPTDDPLSWFEYRGTRFDKHERDDTVLVASVGTLGLAWSDVSFQTEEAGIRVAFDQSVGPGVGQELSPGGDLKASRLAQGAVQVGQYFAFCTGDGQGDRTIVWAFSTSDGTAVHGGERPVEFRPLGRC